MEKALIMEADDNVATAIADLEAGEMVTMSIGSLRRQVTLREPVPFGHKLALQPLAKGANVVKYGEVIGRTRAGILEGQHVHVHNIESLRGRGDLK